MIIHLSEQRFQQIREQAYKLGEIHPTPERVEIWEGQANTTFHLLRAEHSICEACDEERSSAVVSSPVELERLKELMRQGYEDMGDGWWRKGDIYSKYEDNNVTVLDLGKFKAQLDTKQ